MADILHHAVPVEIGSDHLSTASSSGSSSRRRKQTSSSSSTTSSPRKQRDSATTPKSSLKKKSKSVDDRGETATASFQELVEHERPLPPSTTSTSSSRHHRHHKGSSSEQASGKKKSSKSSKRADEQQEEEGERRRHRHHHRSKQGEVDEEGSRASRSRHHHGEREKKQAGHGSSERKRHHRKSSKSSKSQERQDEGAEHHDDIYDRPKIPAVPCLNNRHEEDVDVADNANCEAGSQQQQQQLYENFDYTGSGRTDEGYNGDDDQVLYDVPRSNKVVGNDSEGGDAIYVNDAFPQQEYDVPRVQQPGKKSLSELIPEEYDVPKIRDSLSTIEEEHQDYEVGGGPEVNLTPKSDYGRDINYSPPKFGHKGSPPPSGSSSSSGYRSSSSPSIHSDELYVNEIITSSGVTLPLPSPGDDRETRDIAVETTLERKAQQQQQQQQHQQYQQQTDSRKVPKVTLAVDDSLKREKAREQERARGDEIEREIRRRRKEDSKHRESASDMHQFVDNRTSSTLVRKHNSSSRDNKDSSDLSLTRKNRKKLDEKHVENGNSEGHFEQHKSQYLQERSTSSTKKSARPISHEFNIEKSVPRWDVPNDDFVAIGEITGDCIELKTPTSSPTPIKEVAHEKSSTVERRRPRPLSPPPPPPPPAPATKYHLEEKKESANIPSRKPVTSYTFSLKKEDEKHEPRKDRTGKQTSETDAGTKERKKTPMKDRSVDVYHETVRQRVSSKGERKNAAASVFTTKNSGLDGGRPIKASKNSNKVKAYEYNEQCLDSPPKVQQSTKQHHHQNIVDPSAEDNNKEVAEENDNEDMPSVKQLRSKFEQSQKDQLADEGLSRASPSSAADSEKKGFKKKVGGGGFLVMSSLTRRSAASVGRSLKGYFADMDKANNRSKANVREKPIIAEYATGQQSGKDSNRGSPDRTLRSGAPLHHLEPASTEAEFRRSAAVLNQEKTLPPLVDAMGKWSPLGFVARLYTMQKISTDEAAKHSADAAYMEGYLERLPQGKRRPTAWHSWKKVYVVADAGVLALSADKESRATVVLETIELFGGKIELLDSDEETLIRISDRRDHCLSLR